MKCNGCGGEMHFDPATQRVVCSHCNASLDPEKYNDHHITAGETEYMDAMVYTCPRCGASVMTTDDTAVTFCSYCGTSVTIQGRLEQEKRPDCIIPFMKTKKECEELYREELKKHLFAPKSMRTEAEIRKFRGIYMPYWVYELKNRGGVSGNGSVSRRRGDYVYTYFYRSEEEIQAVYGGLNYDASSAFSDNLSEAIAPFDTAGRKAFNTAYMSGFYADNRDVESYTYMDDAKETVSQDLTSRILQEGSYGLHGISAAALKQSLDLTVQPESGYFPVWFLVSKAKNSDRVSYAVVNGQTGRVAADVPVDFKRYLLGSLIAAVPLFVLFNLFLTLIPSKLLKLAMVITGLCLFLADRMLNRVYVREHGLDDLGRIQKEAKAKGGKQENIRKSAGFREKFPVLIKMIFGLLCGASVLWQKPVQDAYYYGAAILCIFLSIWGFFDIVKCYNLLTTRKPPQMEARGGDEHA